MTQDSITQISVNGLSISCTWRGHTDRSTPLLFLHGLGDSSIITFDRIASHPALAGQSSLLIDLPGYGYSPVTDTWPATIEAYASIVRSVCEVLSLSSVAIAGHSMGGSVAIQVATQSPGLVSRLILAEPLLLPEQSTLGASISKRSEDAFVERGFSLLQLVTRRQANRGDIAARSFQEPLSRAEPRILHRSATSLLEARSPSFYELLAELGIPRTLLIGERTGLDPDTHNLKDVPVEIIPDAGHSMMSEHPDTFAEAIFRSLID